VRFFLKIILYFFNIKYILPKPHAVTLKFDEEKFMFELNFFLHHFINLFLNQEITNKDKHYFDKYFTEIISELILLPDVFVHRDFHSRNIMIKDDKIYLIDFQDARMGNPFYDLSSLLRDSYFQLSNDALDELLGYYYMGLNHHSDRKYSFDEFLNYFDMMSIQRNLKAIGSFAYMKNVKGNNAYLNYIEPTLSYINKNLLKLSNLTTEKVDKILVKLELMNLIIRLKGKKYQFKGLQNLLKPI
ncbi:MAG: phosphotransferase, partial [Halanaerobium sp.]